MSEELKWRIKELEKEVTQLQEENADLKKMTMRYQQGIETIAGRLQEIEDWQEKFRQWRKG